MSQEAFIADVFNKNLSLCFGNKETCFNNAEIYFNKVKNFTEIEVKNKACSKCIIFWLTVKRELYN